MGTRESRRGRERTRRREEHRLEEKLERVQVKERREKWRRESPDSTITPLRPITMQIITGTLPWPVRGTPL